MATIIYATATSLDGYLADAEESLDWLFAVEGGALTIEELQGFVQGVTVIVEGSATYQWVVAQENLVEHPEKWQQYYETRKTYVLTSRPEAMPRVPGADVEFIGGALADHLAAIRAAAGAGDIWVTGGGAVAAQFAAIGALDEVRLSIAPVTLGAGAPLFSDRLESEDLRLIEVHQTGQFIQARYALAGRSPA